MSTVKPIILPEHVQAIEEQANITMKRANATTSYAGLSWQNEARALMNAGLLVTPAHTAALELATALRAYQQKHCIPSNKPDFTLVAVDNPEYRAVMAAFQKVRPLVQLPNRFQPFYAGGALANSFPWAVLDTHANGTAVGYFPTQPAAQLYADTRNKE